MGPQAMRPPNARRRTDADADGLCHRRRGLVPCLAGRIAPRERDTALDHCGDGTGGHAEFLLLVTNKIAASVCGGAGGPTRPNANPLGARLLLIRRRKLRVGRACNCNACVSRMRAEAEARWQP
jgi:hypothetical protein